MYIRMQPISVVFNLKRSKTPLGHLVRKVIVEAGDLPQKSMEIKPII